MLPDHVGQEPEEAGALDRGRELALLLRRHRRDARGHDLAALGDVARQELRVLVIDLGRVRARERAGLAPSEERTEGAAPATAASATTTTTKSHDQAPSVARAGAGSPPPLPGPS